MGGPHPASGPARPGTKPRKAWALQRLRAGGGVTITTSLGGPTVGLRARLEGQDLSYDRISERTRLRGSTSAPAGLTVTRQDGLEHRITARQLALDRARG